ncbi:GNAT family N-acetyltransferase [Aquihabitans sp. McL0605]|uniref:GNAT family N-acetyltransferase n=1 Tax=Aquihabitans sp. McL0605 TaxID=3415671 RepID=UPI003CF62EFC
MAPHIRPLTLDDAADVLRINEAVVHKLAPLDETELAWFLATARCAWGAEVDGRLAGFVFVLEPGAAYGSANYRWFSERYDDFLYLDRVAIDEGFRRTGIGGAVYDQVEALAAASGRPLLLEVNELPPNHASLAFHEARGFRPVGTLAHDGGAKVVRLLAWTAADQTS